jgi:hypothetical protein
MKIENIQRRACIILTGAIRVTKHKTLLKEAGDLRPAGNYTD